MNEWLSLHNMQHDEDPRVALMQKVSEKIGDLSNIRVFGNRVLVAIYERPKQTSGGIILPENTHKEDRYQGKVCMVLKKGAAAFKDDDSIKFNGDSVEVGDWIYAPAKYSRSISLNGITMRIIQDEYIDGTLDHPDLVL